MKFKRNAVYIESLLIMELVMFIGLLFFLFYDITAIVWKDILFILELMAFTLFAFMFLVRGLFYDTVYYDEKGIKIVTRKKTSEYTWNEILRIERIIGGRSGSLGWTLVALTGEKYNLFPFSAKFIEFVKKNFPYLEIRMMP